MKIPRQIVGQVGRCIYCDSTERPLHTEHIVPFGLNGPWELLEATCKNCANITSAFEKEVLRHSLIVPRTALNLPTRHKQERPKQFPLVITSEGKSETVQVPVSQHFAAMILPIDEMPAHLTGKHYEKGVAVKGMILVQVSGPPVEEIAKRLRTKKISVTATWHGNSFERMLAKIGLGSVVAKYGINNLEQIYIRPSILGQKDDIGRWVGTAGDLQLDVGKFFHQIHLSIVNSDIIARIKLFALFNVPEYLVVVGRLRKTKFDN